MATLKYAFDQLQLDFLHLCSLGDDQRIRDALLTRKVDTNYKHKSNGWSALHWAAHRGHESTCLLLIEAGFSLSEKDVKGRTPYEVCPKDQRTLKEILEPGDSEEMVQNNSMRRSSNTSNQNGSDEFVPNYLRDPPFPYSIKNSFDNYTAPATPASPGPLNSPTYSYGRRDSFNKTRFLLVRTSVEKGKETYKRVTLPGGSDVERLKTTIEKACKGQQVEMIFTLPENILIEFDEQIREFKDCQKIDVVFKESKAQESIANSVKKMSSNFKDSILEKEYSQNSEEVEVQRNVEEKLEEARPPTPPEDLSSFVKEPSPPVSLTVTDIESTNGSSSNTTIDDEQQQLQEQDQDQELPKLVPLATRSSLDSDPGDFVKVDKDDAKLGDISTASPAVAGLAAAIPMISAQVEEEHRNAPEALKPTFGAIDNINESQKIPSSKATVVEETKHVPGDHCESNDIAAWIHNNPDVVRKVVTAAAVAGVAGLGYYVYAKKFK